MYKYINHKTGLLLSLCLLIASCKVPELLERTAKTDVPEAYANNRDTTNLANVSWKVFFTDKNLTDLIDTALEHNQELVITLQDIGIAKNEVRIRQGSLLPSVNAKLGAGVEKVGRYTSQGAGDATTEIAPGIETPEPLADYAAIVSANWEVDIWKKLRNAKKSALTSISRR